MSTVWIHRPALLLLADVKYLSHAHNLPVQMWVHKAHCCVQRLFADTALVGERHINSRKQNEKEFSRILVHKADFGQRWGSLPSRTCLNSPTVCSNSSMVSGSKGQYVRKGSQPGPFPPIIRVSQRLYKCSEKCIIQLMEIGKRGMALGLSGQKNFPVFPATPGRNDGNQTSKDFGTLPFQRCLDEEKR